jgi:nitrite reductase/ring-hydroxylating ferredoxin subunit
MASFDIWLGYWAAHPPRSNETATAEKIPPKVREDIGNSCSPTCNFFIESAVLPSSRQAIKPPAGQRNLAILPPHRPHSPLSVAFAQPREQSAGAQGFFGCGRPEKTAYQWLIVWEVLREMAEQLVGKVSEFQDGDRRIVFVGDREIGVFRHQGQFYAYSNYCLHQGGPACEGLTIAKVEEMIMPDKTSRGLYFSDTEMHFVCPWHGYEYDMLTGECVADRKLKLRKYPIVQKGDDIYVVA